MLKIAFRNIFRQKRRSVLTALTMFGGFILAALAIGLTDGTFNNIVNTFTRTRLGHVQIHAGDFLTRPGLNKTIADYRKVGRVIEETPYAEAWAPRVLSAGLASVGERTDAVRIVGLDPGLEDKATSFSKDIVEGSFFQGAAPKPIILGKGLAQSLKVALGQPVVLVSQGADGSLANDKFTVAGIADTGDLAANRTTAYLTLADAQEFFVLGTRVHEIVVVASSLNKVPALEAGLRAKLAGQGLDIEPWQVFAKAFYLAMQAKLKGSNVILYILIIIVAIGVLNTALMAVLERRREYGVLKAIGTRPRQIFSLIVLETLILASMSVVAGLAISVPLNAYIAHHPISTSGLFSQPVTYGGMLYTTATSEVNVRSVLVPTLTVLFAALAVSIFPAIKAAHTDPAKAIRIF